MRASLLQWLALVACASACASEDVTVILAPQGGCDGECGQQDLSCLTHIGLAVVGADVEDAFTMCIPVAGGGTRSLCDHDLGDAFEISLPADLTSVEVVGFASETGCDYGTLFAGGGRYEGKPQVDVQARCNLDCATLAYREYDVRLVDLRSLVEEQTCATPADTQDFGLWLGVLHDARRYGIYATQDIIFDPFVGVTMQSLPTSDGWVRLSGQSFAVETTAERCLGLDIVHGAGVWNTYCVDTSGSTNVCSPEGAIEVAWLDLELAYEVERVLEALGETDSWYFLGLAWDPGTSRPVSEAVVDGVPAGVALYYLDVAGGTARVSSGAKTGASGLFVVVGNMVGPVTVQAPGFVPTEIEVAVPPFNPSAGVVALRH